MNFFGIINEFIKNGTGKTEQARADLARLAIIKQHRAEAAARREAEKKGNSTFLE